MSEELKPCPFCGSTNEFFEEHKKNCFLRLRICDFSQTQGIELRNAWDIRTNEYENVTTSDKDFVYTELIKQPYKNCTFSSGLVSGHPVDTMYIKLERDDEEPLILLLRQDESLSLAWCLIGVNWSIENQKVLEKENNNE